jgi:diguanylate cyclase (GGDEF)-like protein
LVLMVAATLDAVLKSVSPPPREAPRRGIADIVTGLPKARKFVSDLLRHFARLDREGLAGSIMVVSIDGYTQLNACLGRKGISQVLLQIAALLNRISRPSDAVGRIDDDKFAVWLNGADHFTAAERAEQLGLNTSHSLAAASRGMPVSFSVGIAARRPGSKETVNLLLQRADRAMREARKIGPGLWRVAQDGVITGS